MLQIFVNTTLRLRRQRRRAYLISAVAIAISLAHIACRAGSATASISPGGTLLQVRFERPITVDAVRTALARVQAGESVIQEFGDAQEYLIRVPAAAGRSTRSPSGSSGGLRQAGLPGFEVRRLEFVGPQVGEDLQWDAVQAVLWGMVGILVYTAFRFDFKGGVAAIIALLHDVLMLARGACPSPTARCPLPVLAALLTIVGFSINDTIVIFDRIRENRGRGLRKGETLADVINAAINQTLSRTILTSLTVFLVVVILFVVRAARCCGTSPSRSWWGWSPGPTPRSSWPRPIIVDWETWSQRRQRGGQKGRGEGRGRAVDC